MGLYNEFENTILESANFNHELKTIDCKFAGSDRVLHLNINDFLSSLAEERILCAAIKRKEPRKVCRNPYYEGQNDILNIEIGYRHHDIMIRFLDELDKHPDAQGFYTSKGRFVGREEGYWIAKNAGQIINPHPQEGCLYSEDLY